MIRLEIRKRNTQYVGFLSQGHAGYAEAGYDIICAAVSVLVVNTINAIERFTKDQFSVHEDDGQVELVLTNQVSKETALLLDTMVLGLKDIQESYSDKYIQLEIKEV